MAQSNEQGGEETFTDYWIDALRDNCGDCEHPGCVAERQTFKKEFARMLREYAAEDRKQHELEARIDEVNKSFKAFGSYDKQLKTNIPRDDTHYLARRITELRDELKLLGSKDK